MAFLISPQEAKNQKLETTFAASEASDINTEQELKSIKVMTNIRGVELEEIMLYMNGRKNGNYAYTMPSGLETKWKPSGKYLSVELSYDGAPEELKTIGEEFFNQLDEITDKNVRLLNSKEYFYYNYSTKYTKSSEIRSVLRSQGATEIYTTEDDSVIATVDGRSVKYFRENGQNYTLSVEQQIEIMNIGVIEKGVNTIIPNYTNLMLKTNIRKNELQKLLSAGKYDLFKGNMQTPLQNPKVTLNWILRDGYYAAEFSGESQSEIIKEAETIFENLNKIANRDLRTINDMMTAIYTYKTNYTDKGMLLNTLIEHGAEEIAEDGDTVSCKLYDMEMVYKKLDGSNGYTLEITRVTDKNECENVINDLNEEYGMNIQDMTYNKIKERLAQENLRLESEAVMEDNSIVLTIEV